MNASPAGRKHPTDVNPDAVLLLPPTDALDVEPEPRPRIRRLTSVVS